MIRRTPFAEISLADLIFNPGSDVCHLVSIFESNHSEPLSEHHLMAAMASLAPSADPPSGPERLTRASLADARSDDKADGDAYRKRLALLLHDLRGGGAERVTVALANGFLARGLSVDLVLINRVGSKTYFDELHPDIRLIELKQSRTLTSAVGFRRYINERRPDVIISAMTHINIASLIANILARHPVPFIAVEHNQLSRNRETKSGLVRFCYRLVPWIYRHATIVGAVSEGVKLDLIQETGLSPNRVRVLHNPVVTPHLLEQSAEPLDHPWFRAGEPPVILAVGRLTAQKNFDMLIDAFDTVRSLRSARLMILGQGPDREALEKKAVASGWSEDIALPGFTHNPFAYMSRAAVFALSSRWEGLPTVLIEAMACGTAVVATDCPSGPAEILRGGELGALTPVGDAEAFAKALLKTLEEPPKKSDLQRRANDFNVAKSVERYLSAVVPSFDGSEPGALVSR